MPDDVVPTGERIYGDERRNLQQVSLLEEVADGIDVLSQHFDHFVSQLRKLSGQGDFGPLLAEITALSGKLDLLVPPSPEGIADALAKRLPQDMTPEIAAALQAATKNLERLNKKVSAMSIMPSGGSSGHVIVDSGQISSIAQPVEIQNEIGNPIGVSGTVGAIPDRPSQKTGRTYQNIVGDALTVNTTLHTVTAGKTLYVTSLFLEMRNADVVNPGRVRIRDGTTTRFALSASAAVAGQITPRTFAQMTFPEPVRFTTDLNLEVVAGTISANVVATGYEETT